MADTRTANRALNEVAIPGARRTRNLEFPPDPELIIGRAWSSLDDIISDFQKLRVPDLRIPEIVEPTQGRLFEETQLRHMQHFAVMIDHGRRGREAIIDPEITRSTQARGGVKPEA